MDGIHDLGGMQGFGAGGLIRRRSLFFTTGGRRWPGRCWRLWLARSRPAAGEFRHSIERMEPGHYLTSSYYEHWLTAAATLAVEHGLVTRSELEARAGGRFPLSGPVLGAARR